MAIDETNASEIAEARGQAHSTLRPTVPALEELLHHAVPCLDHGFVRVVDYMGDDAAVVQAARVSYGKGTRKLREDRGLIRYLMRHRHTTPFEMCSLKLHVKLPIFVARQWIRHRTASVNEISGRYSVLDSEFYLPATEDLAVQSISNRQGRGAELTPEQAAEVLDILRGEALRAHASYAGLMQGFDLARELARINLTLSTYTQWYWKIDLHNLLHFLALRLHPHAQKEFRVYAQAIADVVAAWVPTTWEAFEDYRLGAFTMSRQGVEVIRAMLAGEPVDQESSGLSKREWDELLRTFELGDRG
jgi:thymidylate synthase (FAD)